ncbi:Predicted flavoproteins [Prochlorococcus marinus str. MIT 9515]|uniref:Predicted flavoproteins n=1 Tax=Prochlorococcus marinus (strain MIT 9515) TaxID=167542 RepID=A2BY82_PROM5|nr:NAD(P)/FAD-dependent oxidoreductase [Prochlorococcus marinus]ABM72743.1 Predicted flavoproteins [Prochlorococcus marinus str. MIT 9515]
MDPFNLVVVGGGAAGFMTAVIAAENGVKRIIILEGSSKLMEKVRISGGGRCNVTNASWIPNELVENYPRGGIKLLESFNRFAAGDVFDWFEKRGLNLKIESDNRVFPVSDSSLDVISCLKKSAITKGVEISTRFFVKEIVKTADNLFNIFDSKKNLIIAKNLILSTGGHPSGHKLAKNFGHRIIRPVPSLFTFTTEKTKLNECSGVSIKNIDIEIQLNNKSFKNRGDLLITHWGFSGPAVLKLSSIAARELFDQKYKFNLLIRWSDLEYKELKEKIDNLKFNNGKLKLINLRPLPLLPKRLWVFLLNKMEINKEKKWSDLLANEREKMINSLMKDIYNISSKGPFGEEFVTSGGVSIDEVNFKSMESLICPGLFFSGEVLDVDGITGGFNFQHCWTSGWIAGKAVSKQLVK